MGLYRLKPKHGTHWFRDLNGKERPIKAGEILECEEWQIRNVLNRFDVVEPSPPPPEPNVGLKVHHRGGPWYDVVNEATGKPINTKPLRKAQAQEIVDDAPIMEMETGEETNGEPAGEDDL